MTDYKMSHCTCIADKEITCIVHPTTRSLKDRIAELEAEVERLEKALDYVYRDCKARAVDGVVPLGAGCWDAVVAALEGKQE